MNKTVEQSEWSLHLAITQLNSMTLEDLAVLLEEVQDTIERKVEQEGFRT